MSGRRLLLAGLTASCGVSVLAQAGGVVVAAPAGPPPVSLFGPCHPGPGCSVLPPPTGLYTDPRRPHGVVFELATRSRTSALVIHRFRFANRCVRGTSRVAAAISVGTHYRFRLTGRGPIKIQGAFLAGRFTGNFPASTGVARGTVRFHSTHCDSGVIRFEVAS